jgi:hypothetical protein
VAKTPGETDDRIAKARQSSRVAWLKGVILEKRVGCCATSSKEIEKKLQSGGGVNNFTVNALAESHWSQVQRKEAK